MEGEQNLQLTRNFANDDDSKSDSDNRTTGVDSQPKRKRYNRHTAHQIQHMESFFNDCPHPDERQRRELSRGLGMEPMQVKFWFQNKRTQMKTQHEHMENTLLRTENEKLRAENMRYKEVLSNASCPTCGGATPIQDTSVHEQQLRIENARLREEIDHISTMTTNYASTPLQNSTMTTHYASTPLQNSTDAFAPSNSHTTGNYNPSFGAGNLEGSAMVNNNVPQNEGSNLVVVELASAAMEELLQIAQLREPLWVPSMDRTTTLLNEEEYLRSFARALGPKQSGFKSEASRETVVVAMNAQKVIEILMDVEQWSNVFSGVVTRASNLQVISPGVFGTYSEAMQLMNAEFHVPTPLVPTRESYFVRYCRQDADGITWTVVDVSLDQLLHSNPLVSSCRKRPSGCIVQDILNGHSKVIWVEHVEVADVGTQRIYKPLITAGLAFGARRWVSILDGYCKRVATVFATNIHPSDLTYLEPEGRHSMLKLAERMVTRFCGGVNASMGKTWSNLSGNRNETVKTMSRKNVDDPTMPFGIHLSVATSFWLPNSPKIMFDFLRDHHNRNEWDMLSEGAEFQQLMNIASGNEAGDRISIYQVHGGSGNQGEVTMLQESRYDPTASYVVYAPIDMLSANAVLGGGDPGLVPLLPSGFAILPDGPIGRGMAARADSGGSLLSIALQVLVSSNPDPKVSMASISVASKFISSTVENIKHALLAKSAQEF